jgi:AI-2 transport protein TqsA
VNSSGINQQPRDVSRFLINAAAFVIVIAGLKSSSELVVPVLISVFLAVICIPPVQWLQKKKLPTWLALLIVITTVWSVTFVIVMITYSSMMDFINTDVEVFQGKIENLIKIPFEELESTTNQSLEKVPVGGLEDGTEQNIKQPWLTTVLSSLDLDLEDIQKLPKLISQKALKYLKDLFLGFIQILTNSFMIMLTTVFMVLEVAGLPAKLKMLPGLAGDNSKQLEQIVQNVRQYMILKTNMSLVTGILIVVWLKIIGVKYFLVWGLLAFFLNYIPTIGSILAAVPAILIALLGTDSAEPEVLFSLGKGAFTAVGFLLVNIVIGNVIEPKVMGKGLGLSTLVVFLSMVFWGWVFGPVGMVLSVPLTTIVKITLDSSDETRWVAILLGPNIDNQSDQDGSGSTTVIA